MKPAANLASTKGLHNVSRIGPYRLLEQIGAGGMGRVFLAERADGEYEQRVALKLVNLEHDEAELLPRFYQERQALAQLAHPNIARLLDGGVSEEGQPYLVMEYIEGLPLDEYCLRNQCDIPTRVRLFREVLAGVHHAHQHLFVHRDLKPSNILVTQEGTPKLLDFGIAKWLQTTQPAAKLTITGQQPMTPEYASPEQVRNEAITTVSDVYSLGVLLYELLTGHSPYHNAVSQTYDLQRAICEDEPQPPSLIVAQNFSAATTANATANSLASHIESATREGSLRMLRRRLAGDLDSIVLKALRKEPQKRYGSAEQFSEDLSRYLDGLPVHAREGKLAYRMGKFVQLHKFGVGAVTLIVCLSLGFGVTMRRETQRTERERDKAQQVSKFLAEIFTLADPNVARGDTINAGALLQLGTARIDSLAGQPDVQAELQDLMGNTYRKLGNYEAAEPLLRSALAFRIREYGEIHHAVADTKSNLGALLQEQAKYEEAARLQREAMMTYRQLLGYESYDNGYSTGNFALTLEYMGEYAAAESLFHESIAILRRLFPQGNEDLAGGINNLAIIKMKFKKFAEAETLFRESHEMIKKTMPPRHVIFAFSLANLGHVRMAQGDSVAAEPLLREGLSIANESFPNGHWLSARIQCRLGTCAMKFKRFAEADSLFHAAYRYQLSVHGNEHPYTQETLRMLVQLYDEWDKPQRGEAYRPLLAASSTNSN